MLAVTVYTPADEALITKEAGLLVETEPSGPLQLYELAPVAAAVMVRVLPTHNVVAEGVVVTPVGAVSTDSTVVVDSVLPHGLVAVSVYTPAEAVLTVNAAGLRSVEVNAFGPLHE